MSERKPIIPVVETKPRLQSGFGMAFTQITALLVTLYSGSVRLLLAIPVFPPLPGFLKPMGCTVLEFGKLTWFRFHLRFNRRYLNLIAIRVNPVSTDCRYLIY